MSANDRLTEKQVGTIQGNGGKHTVSVKDNVIIVRTEGGKTTLSTT